MKYVFLCYHQENEAFACSKNHEAALMQQLETVEAKLRSEGRFGPMARLMSTSTATTLYTDRDPPPATDLP